MGALRERPRHWLGTPACPPNHPQPIKSCWESQGTEWWWAGAADTCPGCRVRRKGRSWWRDRGHSAKAGQRQQPQALEMGGPSRCPGLEPAPRLTCSGSRRALFSCVPSPKSEPEYTTPTGLARSPGTSQHWPGTDPGRGSGQYPPLGGVSVSWGCFHKVPPAWRLTQREGVLPESGDHSLKSRWPAGVAASEGWERIVPSHASLPAPGGCWRLPVGFRHTCLCHHSAFWYASPVSLVQIPL